MYSVFGDEISPFDTYVTPKDVRGERLGFFALIVNNLSTGQPVDIEDRNGTLIVRLNQGRSAMLILTDNSTVQGSWLALVAVVNGKAPVT